MHLMPQLLDRYLVNHSMDSIKGQGRVGLTGSANLTPALLFAFPLQQQQNDTA